MFSPVGSMHVFTSTRSNHKYTGATVAPWRNQAVFKSINRMKRNTWLHNKNRNRVATGTERRKKLTDVNPDSVKSRLST
jgi:hypothetical protein